MINGAIHKSTEDPSTTMFKHCGSETSSKKGSSVKEAMVDAVQQISSAIAIPHQGVWLINHPVMESLLVQVDSLMEGQNVINS